MQFRDAPTDLQELARYLGHDAETMTGLRAKHGARLLRKLQREWWQRQDRARWMHQTSSHLYTESPNQALSGERDAEVVPVHYQQRITAEARKRFLQGEINDRRLMLDRLRRVSKQETKQGRDFRVHFVAIEARIRAMESELDQAA